MNMLDFLLNRTGQAKAADAVITAPAFSLTKVMAVAATILTPIAAVIVDQLPKVNLQPVHYVAMALGLLGFLAVTAAADVIARAVATVADKNGEAAKAVATQNAEAAKVVATQNAIAAQASVANLIRFDRALPAMHVFNGDGEKGRSGHLEQENVFVVAAMQCDGLKYLAADPKESSLEWLPEESVVLR